MYMQIIIVIIRAYYKKTIEEDVPGSEYVNVPANNVIIIIK
jgi:hypothetical protein